MLIMQLLMDLCRPHVLLSSCCALGCKHDVTHELPKSFAAHKGVQTSFSDAKLLRALSAKQHKRRSLQIY